MNPRTVTTLFTLVLSAIMAFAPAAQGKDDFQQDFRVKEGQTIELEMDNGGSLEVEGWDKNLVQVNCEARHNDIEDWNIKITETRKGLKFVAKLKDRSIKSSSFTVRLMVPEIFNIKTESGGGSISIEGVSGKFSGKSAGGAITLHEVSGDAHLKTGGGKIKITDSDLDGRVATGGGGGVVRNVSGNVKATSGGGLISYENVRDNHGDLRGPGRMSSKGITSQTVMYSTVGGPIDVDEAPEGARVSTGGGSIDIHNASRFVQAETGGGDINIEIENGYVEAVTGAGDIEIIVIEGLGDGRDGIDVKTGHGETTLILPEDASLEFDLDLSYTRNSSRDFDIDCDFDLDIEETDEWESRHGSPRKHIYGTASINGGKHRVNISVVNGNITIRKR